MSDKLRRRNSSRVLLDNITSRIRRFSIKSAQPTTTESARASTLVPLDLIYIIISELKKLHDCRTCYARDLTALARVNHAFRDVACIKLYTYIKIHGYEASHTKRKKGSLSRLALLLRTLKSSSDLASLIRRLNLSAPDKDDYPTIAAIISCAIHLDAYTGQYEYFPQPMNGNKARVIGEALYNCTTLKEHSWWAASDQSAYQCFGFKLEEWINYHRNWTALETLVLHGWRFERALNKPITSDILQRVLLCLPSLKSLMLCKFEGDEVTDDTLETICTTVPQLHEIRLEKLPAISNEGIYCAFHGHQHITSLVLVDLPKFELEAGELTQLVNEMSQLKRLILQLRSKFKYITALQDNGHDEIKGLDFITDQPVFTSRTLTYIHWDVLPVKVANHWLHHAIVHGDLPQLRGICVPTDQDRLLQSICEKFTGTDTPILLDNNKNLETPDSRIIPELGYISQKKHPLKKRHILQVPDLEWMKAGSFYPVTSDHSYTFVTTHYDDSDFLAFSEHNSELVCENQKVQDTSVPHEPRPRDLWSSAEQFTLKDFF